MSSTSKSHFHVRTFFSSAGSVDGPSFAEAERRFQTWSVTTNTFLLDTLDLNEGSDAHKRLDKRKHSIVDKFCSALQPCVRSDRGLKQTLSDTIGDAIILDMELRRQVAKIIWVFEFDKVDPSTFVLNGGGKPEPGKTYVDLIVAPGLKKRGTWNGEDLKMETRLLPTEVSNIQKDTPSKERGVRR